jgi:hypothetical protein
MKEKLKELIGNSYNYKGDNILIEDVKFIGANTVIKTNVRSYNLLDTEIEDFINNLLDFDAKKQKVFDLKSVLIETINRVKIDADFVKQANSICSLSTQLINLEKLKR